MTKKYWISLILLSFVSFSSIIINQAKAQTLIGLRGGYSFNTIYFETKSNITDVPVTYLPGFAAGVTFRHFSMPHAGLQVELNYMRRGYKIDNTSPSIINQNQPYSQMEIDYLQVPFMSSFYIFKGKDKIIFNAGLYVALALNGTKETLTFDPNTPKLRDPKKILTSTSEKIDFNSDEYERFDYGLEGGLGYQRVFPFGVLEVNGRMTWGMGNILNSDKPNNPDNTQNISYNVGIAYLFMVRKKNAKFVY